MSESAKSSTEPSDDGDTLALGEAATVAVQTEEVEDAVASSAESLQPGSEAISVDVSISESAPTLVASEEVVDEVSPTAVTKIADGTVVSPAGNASPFAPTLATASTGAVRQGVHLTAEHPGRYEMGDKLGEGGHGEVRSAFDHHLERSVALKQLHAEAQGKGKMSPLEMRFVNEARITGMLEHPGIVPVYELGTRDDGSVYYVMRLVRGESMDQALERAESLNERLRLLPRFIDACNAVAYAHSRGVVHRDLKPENIMLGSFEETLVVDWGLAKVQGQDDVQCEVLAEQLQRLKDSTRVRTVHGSVVGTPAYMPPEQCLGQLDEIDERSDVYALGAVLYHIICGRPPFVGGTLMHIIERTVEEEVLAPSEREPECPPELDAIARRALQKKQADRYDDARALADDVRAFLDGGLVGAHRYTAGQRVGRWLRRHKWTAGVLLSGVLGVSAVYLYQGWRARQALADHQAAIQAEQRVVEEQRRQEALAAVDEMLTDTSRGATAPRWLETYAFRIIHLADPVVHEVVVQRLVKALEHPRPPVRKLAARSLGGMRHDMALEALTARLAEDAEGHPEVIVEIINALGVIGDAKAQEAVRKARWRAGQYSPLWEQTKLAYRMIPMPPVPEGEELTADEWTDRGRALSNKGDRAAAVAAYDRALTLNPNLGRALNNRAIELGRMERYEDALRDYNRAIELDPKEPKGMYNRAVLKRKMEDYAGAVADYTSLIEAGKLVGMSLRSRAPTRCGGSVAPTKRSPTTSTPSSSSRRTRARTTAWPSPSRTWGASAMPSRRTTARSP